MGLRPFKAPNSAGQPGGGLFLDRVFDMIELSFDSLKRVVTDDTLVGPVPIGVGDTNVYHTLGHPPKTWDIVDRDANAVVWRSSTVNPRPEVVIILRASAPVNATFRFT